MRVLYECCSGWHQQAADDLAKLLGQRFGDDPEITAVADSITVEKVTGATGPLKAAQQV